MANKKTIWKVLATALVALFAFYGFTALLQQYSTNSQTYIGSETFETFDEAQKFQAEVVKTAEEVGGKIISMDLSIKSPPVITYRIFIPAGNAFDHGEIIIKKYQVLSTGYTVMLPFFIGFFIFQIYWIWRMKRRVDETDNLSLDG